MSSARHWWRKSSQSPKEVLKSIFFICCSLSDLLRTIFVWLLQFLLISQNQNFQITVRLGYCPIAALCSRYRQPNNAVSPSVRQSTSKSFSINQVLNLTSTQSDSRATILPVCSLCLKNHGLGINLTMSSWIALAIWPALVTRLANDRTE